MSNENPDEIKIFCECGAELTDGNFSIIDGELLCSKCAIARLDQGEFGEPDE